MKSEELAQRVELSEVEENISDSVSISQRDYSLVKSVPIQLEVELGSINLTLDKLFTLKSGELLLLDKEVDEPVTLILDGKKVANGSLVAVDGYYAIEISNIRE